MKWFTLSILCCLLAVNMAFPRHFSGNHHDNMMRMMMGDRYDSSHDECSVSFGERHYCGEQTSDENECYRRSCCYDPCPDCSPNIPRCFLAKRMLRDECDVPYEQKDDCGYYGVTETECFNRGCCWRPSGLPNDPQCFRGVSVRLVNGEESTTMMRSGRVEVWHDGQWGTICDDNFDWHAARVVCRSFGFQYARPRGYAHFGEGSGPVWMDGLRCHGNEERIQECQHHGWRSHDCSHSEDAGVICSHEEMGQMDDFDNDHQDHDDYRKGDEWNWWNWPRGGRGYGRWDSQRNYHDYNNGYNNNYYDNYDNGRWGWRNRNGEGRDFDGWRDGYDNYDNGNRGWWGNSDNWDWEKRDFDGWRNGYDNYDNNGDWNWRQNWGRNWDGEGRGYGQWNDWDDTFDNNYGKDWTRNQWWNWRNWENRDFDGWRGDNYDNDYNNYYNNYGENYNRDSNMQGWQNWRDWEDRDNGQRQQYNSGNDWGRFGYDMNNNYRWNWPEWKHGGWRNQNNYYNNDYDNYQDGGWQDGDRSFSRWNGRHGFRGKPSQEN